jgi:serine/threonine protein kinase
MIRTGYQCGAQLVIVNDNMVAKIFDPLYHEGSSRWGIKKDVVVKADGDYGREAAAYAELQKSPVALRHTAQYYGSWTMEVDTTVGKPGRQTVHKREVRLILIEYLQGKCMENLNPKRLTKKVRSGILKKVFEAEAELYHAGVSHNDVAPRNIIFIGSDWANLGFQVKFIDFNVAQIVRLDKYQRTRQKQQQLLSKYPGRMLSPIARFWDMVGDFCDAGWLPDDGLRANEWLWKHFHKDEKFIPVVRNEKVPEKCPKHLGWDDLVISGCDSGCGSGSGS